MSLFPAQLKGATFWPSYFRTTDLWENKLRVTGRLSVSVYMKLHGVQCTYGRAAWTLLDSPVCWDIYPGVVAVLTRTHYWFCVSSNCVHKRMLWPEYNAEVWFSSALQFFFFTNAAGKTKDVGDLKGQRQSVKGRKQHKNLCLTCPAVTVFASNFTFYI